MGNENKLTLWHYEGNDLVDITMSLDTVNDQICGIVYSFSEFAIFLEIEAPVVSNTAATPNPVAVNTLVMLTSDIEDNAPNISYAEYSTDGGIVWSMMDDIIDPNSIVTASVEIPGFVNSEVLDVCVRGTDAEYNTGIEECIYLPVYDPSAGFVTGGGWIWSPLGAYVPNPTLEGKANFGFVAKYKKGTTVPIGNTEFQFKAGDLNFHSDTYEWLVVAGSRALFKGIGTINGEGAYNFVLTAIDGDLINNSNLVDSFRIRIWEEVESTGEETVKYDNGLDADIYDEDENATTELGGGSIIIHSGKGK